MSIPRWAALQRSGKTKLVENRINCMGLVPAVWLKDPELRAYMSVEETPESFTSLINFSESFEDEEE